MSLDKAILHGKEKRKPYYSKAKRCDVTCRNHGGCSWCENNRLHQIHLARFRSEDELKEYEDEWDELS